MIIFDVDGTIIPGTSCERLFVRYLRKTGVLGFTNLINHLIRAVSLGPLGGYHAVKANKGYLRGFSAPKMSEMGRDFFREIAAPRISRTAINRIDKHLRDNERLILFSGMPDFLLVNFAEYLQVPEHYGSIMEIEDGRFTGRTLGPFPLGRGKVDALQMVLNGFWGSRGFEETSVFSAVPQSGQIPERLPIDWTAITYYADHWTDRYLLSKVGSPLVVNGQPRLLSLARAKRWPTEEWK